jgi:hypothetical protein
MLLSGKGEDEQLAKMRNKKDWKPMLFQGVAAWRFIRVDQKK